MMIDIIITAIGMVALAALIVIGDKIAPQPFYIPTPDGARQVTEQEWRAWCKSLGAVPKRDVA